jgi:hypothetical protein
VDADAVPGFVTGLGAVTAAPSARDRAMLGRRRADAGRLMTTDARVLFLNKICAPLDA